MFKSGFVGIVGRPNVGKSTLLNALLGEKIAITTHKPQTTRNRITGIYNRPDGQYIFVDTPGIHNATTPLNRTMVETALDTFGSVDLTLLVCAATEGIHPGDRAVIEKLKDYDAPVFLTINKIDGIEKKLLLPLIDEFRALFSFREIIPVSARNGDGIEILLNEIGEVLPEGPRYFPDDIVTDRTERFIAAEMIREKIMLLARQEIPYVTAVAVDVFKEDEARHLIRIQATVNVEKDSQKGILIGKKGSMLKEIGSQARREMEQFFGARVFLELFVRVRKDWTTDERMLREFGYKDK
ncbi:MAG: GTPase Era [Smithellaceae bacterium]|nr:GTPase Era [Smithellaceae bacterium]